jgi:hypothetical protein
VSESRRDDRRVPQPFAGANLVLSFALELAVLASIGVWGFGLGDHAVVHVLVGVGGPIVYAVLWGAFAAPKASWPMRGLTLGIFKFLWFASGVAALAASGYTRLAGIFAVLCVVNRLLARLWHQASQS